MPPRRLSKKTLRAVQKYGPTVDDIAQQYGVSGTALLAKLVVGESGDNAQAVSSAGARGRTQFMPGSRDIAVQKYGVDPWKDEDQAVHAAALHLRGKINGSKGLEGYNPGMPSYPQYILNQKVGDVRGRVRNARQGAPEAPQSAPQQQYTTETTPGVDNSGLRRQLVGQFLQQGGVKNSSAVLGLAASYGQAADVPGTTTRVPLAGQPEPSRPRASQKVRLPKDGKNNWGVLDHAGQSGKYLQSKYGIKEIGGYRASDPFPDHPSRKALDLMVYEDRKKGSAIARELTKNHKQHRVKYLIWNQRIWHPGEGWRKMEDRGSPTQNHQDHVHVLYE